MEKARAVNNSITHEPRSSQVLTHRFVHIIDAKHEKADLQLVDSMNCSHLSLPCQSKLLKLLTEYKELFDGTLGDWKAKLISFELMEGAK